jgi:DNA-binding MarR family transcriptional regulator
MAKKTKIITKSPQETLFELERLARLLRSSDGASGLHPAQWEALRYIARANRFSNSPRALALYLGATKGTISQTVLALMKRGLIAKAAREGDSRSVTLVLTEVGQALLANDHLQHVENLITDLGDKTRKRFAKGVSELLSGLVTQQNEQQFGQCYGCRFLRERGASDSDYCMKFEVRVVREDLMLLCVEHVSAN